MNRSIISVLNWTGFRHKKLWNWLELLFIPVVLATGVVLFNATEARTDREIAENRFREDALQTYFEDMSRLLLDHGLRQSNQEEVRTVAKAKTLTVLHQLDGERKGKLVRFLYDSGLIIGAAPIISLETADLSYAKLQRVRFIDANLRGADLSRADLSGAHLLGGTLHSANLQRADLSNTILGNFEYLPDGQINITKPVDIKGADLGFADLSGAITFQPWRVWLARAASIAGATMPDRTVITESK